MPLRGGGDQSTIDANVAELIASGHPRDQAVAIAYDHARRKIRADAAAGPHAQVLLHMLAHAQKHGLARKRRAMPKQNYPHALEAEYGTRLVALVRRARGAYDRLVAEMPRLLARAQATRGDASLVDERPILTDTNDTRDFAGFSVVIENPVGSTRTWMDRTGQTGHTLMKYAYGYLADSRGADGDEVDVYLGPDEGAAWVYVIHQNVAQPVDPLRSELRRKAGAMYGVELPPLEPEWGYDEDKTMLGFPSSAAAEAAYHAQYTDTRFFGGMSTMSLADFRAALRTSDGAAITNRMDDGDIAYARQLIDEARDHMKRELTPSEIQKLASFFARETSQSQRRELARQLSAGLGIDVIPDERYVPGLIDYFTHENATLIGSIPDDLHRDVANLTARAFTKRMDPETYASQLQARFDVAESRARFIARDQLGKLWGQLNAVRQRGVGITHFTWRSREDSLVRPSHRRVNRQVFSYDAPPSIGKDGGRLLPGEDYGCRCGGDPVVSGILAATANLRASSGGHDKPL